MNIEYELRRVRLGAVAFKGDEAKTESNPYTSNADKRNAVQGGAGVSGDGNMTIVESADSDVLKALAAGQSDAVNMLTSAGRDVVKASQDAIVKLNATSTAANAASWDTTVKYGAELVDKLIDQSNTLGGAAIASFKPTENANADIGKYAMIAAAVVAGAVLLNNQRGRA